MLWKIITSRFNTKPTKERKFQLGLQNRTTKSAKNPLIILKSTQLAFNKQIASDYVFSISEIERYWEKTYYLPPGSDTRTTNSNGASFQISMNYCEPQQTTTKEGKLRKNLSVYFEVIFLAFKLLFSVNPSTLSNLSQYFLPQKKPPPKQWIRATFIEWN